MPHVIVKLWPGKSEHQKRRLADAITKDIATILNYGDESVSVALEEVDGRRVGREGVSPGHRGEGGDALQEARIRRCRPATTPRKKKEPNHARSSSLRSARRALRGARRTPDHRADGCDHPAVGDLHLRLGPVAVSRHQRRRASRRRWATSTAASSRRSAARVTSVKPGQFVIGSFFASDNTCPHCRAGYQTSCEHRQLVGGAQAPFLRVPLADGTLVATQERPVGRSDSQHARGVRRPRAPAGSRPTRRT